jgi:hypothetical protein
MVKNEKIEVKMFLSMVKITFGGLKESEIKMAKNGL